MPVLLIAEVELPEEATRRWRTRLLNRLSAVVGAGCLATAPHTGDDLKPGPQILLRIMRPRGGPAKGGF
jgi:tRNA(Ile)-lysidine synthase TilS/MesJ